MLTTPELITALAGRGLLPSNEADRFRRLYDNAPEEFGPRVLLKWLVNHRLITAEQAERIIAAPASHRPTDVLDEVLGRVDELELAPLDDQHPVEEPTAPREAARRSSPGSERPELKPTPPAAEVVPNFRSSVSELFDELIQETGSDPLAPRPRPPVRKGWDTPLMLAGGGALLLLVFGGAFLVWRIDRQSADEAFAEAEEAYGKAAYTTAVERFDRFLNDYPSHPAVGLAKVHRGLAEIRIAVEAGDDWPTALETARHMLPEIASQAEFASSRADLSVLLPEIAHNLAKQALDKSNAVLLVAARDARGLISKYLPGEEAAPRVRQADDLLTLAARRLDLQKRIDETIAAMRAATERGEVAAAFDLHRRLLDEFPEAVGRPDLDAAASALTAAAATNVRRVADGVATTTDESPSNIVGAVSLVRYASPGGAIAKPDAPVCVVVARGTAFALDAATGKVRWRREVGVDCRFPPFAIGEGPTSTWLLDDARRGEVVLVEAATGKLRARITAPDDEIWPSISGDQLLVTLRRGRIIVVDLKSGRASGFVQFPEELTAECIVDSRGGALYQLARSGRLYVLDPSLKCVAAASPGHEAGHVRLPPLSVGRYLLIVETLGETSRLRLFEADGAGGFSTVGTKSLDESVLSPPRVSQRRLIVAGSRGGLYAFDLSGAAGVDPLKPIAVRPGDANVSSRRYVTLKGLDLWAVGAEVERLELQPALSRLAVLKSWTLDGRLQQPPQWIDDVLVDVRQNAGGGIRVSALDPTADQPRWQTDLAPSFDAAPAYDTEGKRLVVAAGGASAYEIATVAAREGWTALEPVVHFERPGVGADRASTPPALLPTGEAAWRIAAENASAGHELLLFARSGGEPRVRILKLPADVAGEPIIFGKHLVVACRSGAITLLDPNKPDASPARSFVPPLTAGTEINWSSPVVAGDSLIVADCDKRMYRLQAESASESQLTVRGECPLPRPILPEIAALDGAVYCVEKSGLVSCYALQDLQALGDWELPGRRIWGPITAGRRVYVGAAGSTGIEVLAFTGDGKLAWRKTFDAVDGASFHPPTADAARSYMASTTGELFVIDSNDGTIVKRLDVGSAPAGSPTIAGDRLVIPTAAGELLWIVKP